MFGAWLFLWLPPFTFSLKETLVPFFVLGEAAHMLISEDQYCWISTECFLNLVFSVPVRLYNLLGKRPCSAHPISAA